MLTRVETARDLLIFRYAGRFLMFASDTLGAIGEKAGDHLAVPSQVAGRYTVRVCLSEVLAAGATPAAVISLVCNEWDPTGRRVLEGIRAELADVGLGDLPVSGSSEENMPTPMTAFGICVMAEASRLRWRETRAGDSVFLLGQPYVGAEVLARPGELLTPQVVSAMLARLPVGDLLPCGSGGIERELRVLEAETQLRVQVHPHVDRALLGKSAGPATCAIFTLPGEKVPEMGLPVRRIGRVESLPDT